VRRTGRPMMWMAALITPALLTVVVLFVHGTTPHGHRAAVAVVSAQAWQADPTARTPDGRFPDECPQPFDNCDAGVIAAAAPLSCAYASPFHQAIAGPTGQATLLAVTSGEHGSSGPHGDRARQDTEQSEPVQSQVYRC
jgi:hypothetical protein